jgi:hypothetical protein
MQSVEARLIMIEVDHCKDQVVDHEDRLRKLEYSTVRITASVSVAAAIFSMLGAILAKML